MAEDLGDVVEQDPRDLDEIAQEFCNMVDQRLRNEARVYYNGLTKEQQDYITHHKKYSWSLKALRVSCI